MTILTVMEKIDFADWVIFAKWIEFGRPHIKKFQQLMTEFAEDPANEKLASNSSF